MMKITAKVKAGVKKSGIEVLSLDPIILKIKTLKIAQNGLANKDIIEQLASFLDNPRRSITIIQGLTSTTKIIEIDREEEELRNYLKEKEGFLL